MSSDLRGDGGRSQARYVTVIRQVGGGHGGADGGGGGCGLDGGCDVGVDGGDGDLAMVLVLVLGL